MPCDSSLSDVSDAELLARLTKLVQSGRRVTAEILRHLAEVEDRRLHLKASYNSLFSYCLTVHGMSEDEACRRIEVARLGRRFNSIFGLLASGALSLSVAALLKDCLTAENQGSLLAAVSGKSVRAAREELAARFPVPDVPSSIRKLPLRTTTPLRTGSASLDGEEAPTGSISSGSARGVATNLLEASSPSSQPASRRDFAATLPCEARAFLEFDHEQPLGKDGGSDPVNVRLLCRAHNRYCAELEFGPKKIDREIARSKLESEATPRRHASRATTDSARN